MLAKQKSFRPMTRANNDLKSQLMNALLTANGIGKLSIEIRETDGTVTLIGVVESEEDRFEIEALAKEQLGVVDVINELKVKGL